MEAIDSADTTDESDIFELEPMNELRVGTDVQLTCMVKVGSKNLSGGLVQFHYFHYCRQFLKRKKKKTLCLFGMLKMPMVGSGSLTCLFHTL